MPRVAPTPYLKGTNMRQRVSFGIVSLMALTAAIAMLAIWRTQSSSVAVERLSRRVGSLSQDLLDSHARPGADLRPLAPVVDTVYVSPPPLPKLQEAPAVRTEVMPKEAPSAEDQRVYVQTTFSQQSVDPVWSRDATSQAKEIFNSFASGTTSVRSVECRSSLCRVELAQGSPEEAQRVAHELMSHGKLGWQGGISAAVESTNPDGSVNYVLFLARNEIPVLE